MDADNSQERRAPGTGEPDPTDPRRALPADEPYEPHDNDKTSIADRGYLPPGEGAAESGRDANGAPSEPPPYPGPPPHDSSDDNTRAFDDPSPTGGRLLGDRYELGDVIGRGGMAEVRRAYDTRLGRWVAVKELRPDLASDPTFQARFRREAQSAAGLNHPNIVAVYDTGDEHDPLSKLDIPYIVMELVEGHTLREILKDGRKILPERALELSHGVLDALSYSHKAGIIHRDIKPANVMLTPQGNVKVMDFGIARAVSDASSSMTQTAAVIGTAQYLSPEQARGETVDARSDIYSAGCLLYELLLGRPPFVGDSPVSVAYQHVRELPVPPSQIDELITPNTDAVVLTALAKDPAERYQSARAMADDISRLLAGETLATMTPASAPSAPEPTQVVHSVTEEEIEPEEEPRKRRTLPIVLAVLSVVLVGLLLAGLWWVTRPPAETTVPQVSVPNTVGQQRSAAETAIRTARLVPEVREVEGADDTTIGTVIRQNPPGGGLLDPGSTVQLEVNTGPEKARIPSGLVGRDADEAERLLNDAGFESVRTTPAQSEPGDARENSVLVVRPSEGQEIAVSTEIVLEVATGRSQVPNWIGWNQASVEQDRRTKGFTNVAFETRDTTDPNEIGTVIATSPNPGTQIERNDRVVVTIGQAPPLPTAEATTPTPIQPTAEATPTAGAETGPTPTTTEPTPEQ